MLDRFNLGPVGNAELFRRPHIRHDRAIAQDNPRSVDDLAALTGDFGIQRALDRSLRQWIARPGRAAGAGGTADDRIIGLNR